MARGTRVGALFVWLACGGCGSTPIPESVPEVAEGMGSALKAPPSLPGPTCIPSVDAAPAVEAQACEVSSVWANGHRQRARYDADGRLLELRTTDSGGALLSVETHVWKDGVELQRRVSRAGGAFEQSDWTYDPQLRPILRVDQGSRYGLTEYEYNDQGHLGWSTTRDSQGAAVGWGEYRYDDQGRLTGISSDPRCDLDLNRCETRSYWPDGRLRHLWWVRGSDLTFSEQYNELGQLIGSTWADGPAGGTGMTTRTYDSQGRLSRLQTNTTRERSEKNALTTRVYTDEGWLEQFAETHRHCVTFEDETCVRDYRRTTQRASFVCGTSAVALQEWDINEDGIVDASRTYTRDRMGRLVREDYSGLPGMDEGPLLREFQYDCY